MIISQSLKPKSSLAHASGYLITCAVLCLLWLCGWADTVSPQVVFVCAVCIALLGVPHGGLDHWLGRKLLSQQFGSMWSLIFFPAYLLVAAMVAWSWIEYPVPTILVFFLLSAWHFGCEELAERSFLVTISVGGMVIWLTALIRPHEMTQLLTILIPSDAAVSLPAADDLRPQQAKWIVLATQGLAVFFIPIGLASGLYATAKDRRWKQVGNRLSARLGTVLVVLITPILVSFTAYFCLWHSLLGLRRLRSEEGLSLTQFITAAAPLSLMAVLLIVIVTQVSGQLSLQSIGQHTGLQMIFIGLASIAVPHILLHESQKWFEYHSCHPRLQPLGSH